MANNIVVNANNVTAVSNRTFAAAGLTSTNIDIIFTTDPTSGSYLSWRGNRQINDFTAFTLGTAYTIIAKQAIDLTADVTRTASGSSGLITLT